MLVGFFIWAHYFKTESSGFVPEEEMEVSLFYRNDNIRYEARKDAKGICRIRTGWTKFSRENGFQEGQIVVVRIDEEIEGELLITFHPMQAI